MTRGLRYFLALLLFLPVALAGATPSLASGQNPVRVAALDNKPIGAVQRARGDARARQQSETRRLSGGDTILFQDKLLTGANTRLMVTFEDGTKLSLGDNSELLIDEMIYEPGQRGSAAIRVAKGVFRMVSGQVNKVPGGEFVLNTPVASIGIRGTDFWGEQTPGRLFMALLDDGELTITTPAGSVTLTDPMTAVEIIAGQAPSAVVTLTAEQLEAAVATVTW